MLALLLLPLNVGAGVSYDVATRPVDENLGLSAPAAPPVVTHYFVDAGNVRIGGANAKTTYVFKGRMMYVVDHAARVVHVLKHATSGDVLSHYGDAVKQLEEAATRASAEEHDGLEKKAQDMRAVSQRLREPVPRDFRVTARFESVDGHACRIWEELENGAKRLELCVAPAATVPGAADILSGMKTLSQFREGSDFALGIEFGLSDWWPDVVNLGGLPLLIREYKYDSVVAETMLTAMHPGVAAAGQLDIPDGYRAVDGPEYAQWYVR